jgi:hypothetical protein
MPFWLFTLNSVATPPWGEGKFLLLTARLPELRLPDEIPRTSQWSVQPCNKVILDTSTGKSLSIRRADFKGIECPARERKFGPGRMEP